MNTLSSTLKFLVFASFVFVMASCSKRGAYSTASFSNPDGKVVSAVKSDLIALLSENGFKEIDHEQTNESEENSWTAADVYEGNPSGGRPFLVRVTTNFQTFQGDLSGVVIHVSWKANSKEAANLETQAYEFAIKLRNFIEAVPHENGAKRVMEHWNKLLEKNAPSRS